jgi:2-keto-3-deoxy-L-rhamnonate aldolase RhmA
MNGKTLKQKLVQGETVYGTFFTTAVTPSVVKFIPDGSLDFVIASAEHTSLDLAEFLPLYHALQAKNIACLVRTHSREPDDVSKVCDVFDGVVVPYVEDVEQAKRLAAAAVYRPLKGEALDKVLAGGAWPSEATKRYVTETKCPDTIFVPMIESVRGVENLDAICSIPGVNAVFVGPNDLTVNMGIPNEYDHPDLIAILKRIIDTADRRHVAAGCWFGKPDQALRTIKQGARFVVYGNDGALLQDAMGRAFSQLRGG